MKRTGLMSSNEYGKIYKRIWGDPDFKALPAEQQLQYFKLLSQTDISQAGVITLATTRWAGQTAGASTDDIEQAVAGLEAARFVVVDRDTQEVLVRSYIRNDLGWRSPKTLRGIEFAIDRVLSPMLRGAIADELARIDTSELSEKVSETYGRSTRECVETELKKLCSEHFFQTPDTPPDGVSDGVSDTPSDRGFTSRTRQTDSNSNSNTNSNTNSNSNTPSLRSGGPGGGLADDPPPEPVDNCMPTVVDMPAKTKRGTRLPDDWRPTRCEANSAVEDGHPLDWLDTQLASFCDYWHAKAGAQATKLDWDATWRNWLRRANDQPGPRRPQPSNQPDWQALLERAQARDIAEGVS